VSDFYLLDKDHKLVKIEGENACFVWAEQFEKTERVIVQEHVRGCFVSTVFLGLDHSFGGGRPQVFETMIFHGICDQYQKRSCSYVEALHEHNLAIKEVERYSTFVHFWARVMDSAQRKWLTFAAWNRLQVFKKSVMGIFKK
jgi:hypothetical protein